MKTLSDIQYALKAAVRRAVTLSGGCNGVASIVRVDAPRLSRYGNADAPEYAPIDVCIELDRAAGTPVILRAYADMLGFDLVDRNNDAANLARDVTALAGELARDSGEVIAETISAAQDGALSPNEVRRIDDAAANLQDRVVRLRTATRKHIVG